MLYFCKYIFCRLNEISYKEEGEEYLVDENNEGTSASSIMSV